MVFKFTWQKIHKNLNFHQHSCHPYNYFFEEKEDLNEFLGPEAGIAGVSAFSLMLLF